MWVEFVTVELLPAVEEPSCLHHIVCNLLQNLDQVQCLTAGREEGGVDGHLHKQALYDISYSLLPLLSPWKPITSRIFWLFGTGLLLVMCHNAVVVQTKYSFHGNSSLSFKLAGSTSKVYILVVSMDAQWQKYITWPYLLLIRAMSLCMYWMWCSGGKNWLR